MQYRPLIPLFLLLLALCSCSASSVTATEPSAPATAPAPHQRIVTLGDSITSGHSYQYLIIQVLSEHHLPLPQILNSGIGGDNSAGMIKRLDRDVFDLHPDLVIVSNGANDFSLTADEYRKHMDTLISTIRARQIPVIIATPSTINPRFVGANDHLAEFAAVCHELATKYDCKVANVFENMIKTPGVLWEEDGCHLNWEGYRAMTGPILAALGHGDLPIPAQWEIPELPGVIHDWQVLACTGDAAVPLTDATAANYKPNPGAGWKSYHLPEPLEHEHWWHDQGRAQGIAMSLKKNMGPAPLYRAYAVIHADKQRTAFINTGAEIGPVFFNGRLVNAIGPGNNWHPGCARYPVVLHVGDNPIIVETHERFFISVTDDDQW